MLDDRKHFVSAGTPNLSNLALLYGAPVAILALVVLLEALVELAEQIGVDVAE